MGLIGGIIYFILCIIVGSSASNRGRSGFGYFLLSLIISPLIGFIIVIALGENKQMRKERIQEDAEIRENVAQVYRGTANNNPIIANNTDNLLAYNDTKKCPFCAELIKNEAIVCRFCGRDLPNDSV